MPYDITPRSQLPANASRYDWFAAEPDAATLVWMWSIWAFVSFASASASLITMVAILRSPKTRSSMFNRHVVFLLIPDFVFSLGCGITCTLNAAHGEFFNAQTACEVQGMYIMYGIGASIWVNVCIATMLSDTIHASIQLRQPRLGPRMLMCRVAAANVFAALLAATALLEASPVRFNAMGGMACLWVASSPSSELYFWSVIIPLTLLVPLCIILASVISVVRTGFFKKGSSTTGTSTTGTSSNTTSVNKMYRSVALFFAKASVLFAFPGAASRAPSRVCSLPTTAPRFRWCHDTPASPNPTTHTTSR